MDRLLVIVVTRDWATQGGPQDEFCVDWLRPPGEKSTWFPDDSLDLLLIHGYSDRFGSEEDVRKAVESHTQDHTAGRSYAACVVLQHSSRHQITKRPPSLRACNWVELGRYGTAAEPIQRAFDDALAKLSTISEDTRNGWKEEFRKIAPAIVRDGIAQLIHAIVHLFLPLEVDFSGLREAPDEESRRSYAAEMLRTRTGDSYEVRLWKLRFWVAKVGKTHIRVDDLSILPNDQCFLELVKKCGLNLEDESVKKLIALCGLVDEGPPVQHGAARYYAPRSVVDDSVLSFFQKLDEADHAEALIKQCSEKLHLVNRRREKLQDDLPDDLDFLEWFDKLRGVLEEIHDRILSGQRDASGEA